MNGDQRDQLGYQGGENVRLREYVEALLMEKQRALDAALAAQKEAVVKAEVATDRIAARAQSDQESLRREMSERLASVRRELELAVAAQREAVIKQETANEKRFEAANEWRGQSADRERSQQEQMAVLNSTFMPREVAEANLDGVRRLIESRYTTNQTALDELRSRLDKAGGERAGALELRGTILAIGAFLISITALVILIATHV